MTTRLWPVLLLLALAACAAPIPRPTGPGPVGEARGRWREQAAWIPAQDADGTPRLLYANTCRPEGTGPFRVAVLNHGTGPDRPVIAPAACDSEVAEWFLHRGYLVVAPIRRGFGATGGRWGENEASTGPGCNGAAPYRQALETARDIGAAVDYATALPGARPDGAIVVGQSTGGYGTIAYASLPHPKVVALVNFAGGRGGRVGNNIGNVCHSDRLVEAAGRFGATAGATPMLWLYATNDAFFSPDLGRAMLAAFTAAGGRAEFVETGVSGLDGHGSFRSIGGSSRWGPILDRYLAQRTGDAPG